MSAPHRAPARRVERTNASATRWRRMRGGGGVLAAVTAVAALLVAAAACGDASSPEAASPDPTTADAAETLTLRYWQAPAIANPYLSAGYKDRDVAAVTLEPLAKIAPDGSVVPALAVETPTVENGGIAPDHSTVTWRLAPGVRWSDGAPMTAEDVVFTWRYCVSLGTRCGSAYTDIAVVEAIDELTVRIAYDAPPAYPYGAFVGTGRPVLSRAQFADCTGEAAEGCVEENRAPLGTGPYRIVEFTPDGDVTYEPNPHYRGAPAYFDAVRIIGGGDVAAAASAVLETGEADFAWNLQAAPDVLSRMEAQGRGRLVVALGSTVERIVVNHTNPDPALGVDRSERLGGANPHPFLTFAPIPQAMSMAIDRVRMTDEMYGFAGRPACNIVVAPAQFASSANDGCL